MSDSLFINSVYKGNLHDILKILTGSSIDVHSSRDSRGMTALHIASLNGHLSVLKFLIEFSKRRYNDPELLLHWINDYSEEGFLAAHFAAFRGHYVSFNIGNLKNPNK